MYRMLLSDEESQNYGSLTKAPTERCCLSLRNGLCLATYFNSNVTSLHVGC